MDIVSRLKEFIAHLGMTSTQFADACKVPRPTMSCLLNGRNKKVSDELLRKFHAEFPQLNIAWLLFGEGNMETVDFFQTSEPQNALQSDANSPQRVVNKDDNPVIDFDFNYSEPEDDMPDDAKEGLGDTETDSNILDFGESIAPDDTQPAAEASPAEPITFMPDSRKKIVNIIVYYNDNSFESFVPRAN